MDNVLIDTDVILDLLFNREPFSNQAIQVFALCEKKEINGFITPVIISNVYYLLCRTAKHDYVIQKLTQLLKIISVLEIDHQIVVNALHSGFKDFEDALQNFAAQKSGKISLILTRNIKDYKKSNLPVMTPENYIKARIAAKKMENKKTDRIQAVLFDMDGVIVNSEKYINRAAVEMFKEKGYEVDPEDFTQFTGMGENKYLGGVAEIHNIPFDLEKDKARTYEIYEELVSGKLGPLPGVRDFIAKCKKRNLRLALASSADQIKVKINLREIGINHDTFQAILSAEDVTHKKPAPDIFLKAAEKLDVPIENCLVIEDAVSGVKAGKTAGAKVLALTTSFEAQELEGADWIAGDLSEVGDEVVEW